MLITVPAVLSMQLFIHSLTRWRLGTVLKDRRRCKYEHVVVWIVRPWHHLVTRIQDSRRSQSCRAVKCCGHLSVKLWPQRSTLISSDILVYTMDDGTCTFFFFWRNVYIWFEPWTWTMWNQTNRVQIHNFFSAKLVVMCVHIIDVLYRHTVCVSSW